MGKRALVRVVTQKGQVTIPVQLRRSLGIEPGDRIIFSAREGEVILKPTAESLISAHGAVEPLTRPEDFQALRDRAVEEHALHTAEEMQTDHEIS